MGCKNSKLAVVSTGSGNFDQILVAPVTKKLVPADAINAPSIVSGCSNPLGIPVAIGGLSCASSHTNPEKPVGAATDVQVGPTLANPLTPTSCPEGPEHVESEPKLPEDMVANSQCHKDYEVLPPLPSPPPPEAEAVSFADVSLTLQQSAMMMTMINTIINCSPIPAVQLTSEAPLHFEEEEANMVATAVNNLYQEQFRVSEGCENQNFPPAHQGNVTADDVESESEADVVVAPSALPPMMMSWLNKQLRGDTPRALAFVPAAPASSVKQPEKESSCPLLPALPDPQPLPNDGVDQACSPLANFEIKHHSERNPVACSSSQITDVFLSQVLRTVGQLQPNGGSLNPAECPPQLSSLLMQMLDAIDQQQLFIGEQKRMLAQLSPFMTSASPSLMPTPSPDPTKPHAQSPVRPARKMLSTPVCSPLYSGEPPLKNENLDVLHSSFAVPFPTAVAELPSPVQLVSMNSPSTPKKDLALEEAFSFSTPEECQTEEERELWRQVLSPYPDDQEIMADEQQLLDFDAMMASQETFCPRRPFGPNDDALHRSQQPKASDYLDRMDSERALFRVSMNSSPAGLSVSSGSRPGSAFSPTDCGEPFSFPETHRPVPNSNLSNLPSEFSGSETGPTLIRTTTVKALALRPPVAPILKKATKQQTFSAHDASDEIPDIPVTSRASSTVPVRATSLEREDSDEQCSVQVPRVRHNSLTGDYYVDAFKFLPDQTEIIGSPMSA